MRRGLSCQRGLPISRVLSDHAAFTARLDDHFSRPRRYRRRSCTRFAGQAVRDAPSPRSGLAPGGVCRAASLSGRAVGSYPTVSPLPDGLRRQAVCFLLHCPYPAATRDGCIWQPPYPVEPGLSSAISRWTRSSGSAGRVGAGWRVASVKTGKVSAARLGDPGQSGEPRHPRLRRVRTALSCTNRRSDSGRRSRHQVSSRLRNIHAVFSCTSMRWVSRSAVG